MTPMNHYTVTLLQFYLPFFYCSCVYCIVPTMDTCAVLTQMRSGGRASIPSPLTPDCRGRVRSTEPPKEPPCYSELRPTVHNGEFAAVFRDEPIYRECQVPINPVLMYDKVPVPPTQPRPKVTRPGAAVRLRRVKIPKPAPREIPTAWAATSSTPIAWGPTSPVHGVSASMATRDIPVGAYPHLEHAYDVLRAERPGIGNLSNAARAIAAEAWGLPAMGNGPAEWGIPVGAHHHGVPRVDVPVPREYINAGRDMAPDAWGPPAMGNGARNIAARPRDHRAMPEVRNPVLLPMSHALPSLRDHTGSSRGLAGGERCMPSFRDIGNIPPTAVVGDGDAAVRGLPGVQGAGRSLNAAQVLPAVRAPTPVMPPQPVVSTLLRIYN